MTDYLPRAHGGTLVNRMLREQEREGLLEEVEELPRMVVDKDTGNYLRNIAEGAFSPLKGFMVREDYLSVIHEKRLAGGEPWTMPIILDVPEDRHSTISEGDEVLLNDQKGHPLAILHVSEIYGFDKEDHAIQVYGTRDRSHPGVEKTLKRGEVLFGGEIDMIASPHTPFDTYHFSPQETRKIFKNRKWRTVAGFQTRNIPHMGHEYIQKTALTLVDGLFINPIIGRKKKGDFKDEVILSSYETLIKNYFREERVVLGILEAEMSYAGPREAVFHAIIRKNFGCTHFIVGRDHAGVGDFYPPYAAHHIFSGFPDLEITPIFFPSVFLCGICKSITNDKACPHGQKCRREISGTETRRAICSGETDDLMVRPEVADIICDWKAPLIQEAL